MALPLLALSCLALRAAAQEAEVEVIPLPDPGVQIGFSTWGMVAQSTAAEGNVVWGGRLAVNGPLAFGEQRAPARMYIRVDLAALPDRTFNFTDPGTWGRTAEITGGLTYRIGRWTMDTQEVHTSILGVLGIDSAVGGEVQSRFVKRAGLGLRLAELWGGSFLDVGCGRRGANGDWEWACFAAGQVPLPRLYGLTFGGDFTVVAAGGTRADVVRFFAGVDLLSLLDQVRR